jgi:hypothetical protein
MVSTFFEKANTSFPLQSRATAAIDEKRGPTAASQLILMIPKFGQTQPSFPLERELEVPEALRIYYIILVYNIHLY